MVFRVLAQATMVAHFLVLAFLVFGGFIAWRWPKVWFAHLAMVLWGLMAIAFPVICPLTHWENLFRAKAGDSGLHPGGFIDEYITGVVYPGDQVIMVRWIVVVIVAFSWAVLWWRVRRRRLRTDEADPRPQSANR